MPTLAGPPTSAPGEFDVADIGDLMVRKERIAGAGADHAGEAERIAAQNEVALAARQFDILFLAGERRVDQRGDGGACRGLRRAPDIGRARGRRGSARADASIPHPNAGAPAAADGVPEAHRDRACSAPWRGCCRRWSDRRRGRLPARTPAHPEDIPGVWVDL